MHAHATQEAVRLCEIELARKRARLSGSLSRLRERAVEVSQWRTHVKEHPGAALLVAAAAGLLVGTWLSPSRRWR